MAPTSTSSPIPCIAVVGVGLIGGSFAAAVKQRNLAHCVIGVGRDLARLRGAQELGLVDEITDSIAVAARRATCMMFCTPVDCIVAGVREAAAHAAVGTLLTDAGSVKGRICDELAQGLPEGVHFVGGHPLAGSEKQGYRYARADLFEQRTCIVTPTAGTDPGQVRRLQELWQAVGSQVVTLTPQAHDQILASTSHLPHLVASVLAGSLRPEHRPFVASGFRDTTRIAAGEEHLWSAIFLQNAEALLEAEKDFCDVWAEFYRALRHRNGAALTELLKRARENRESL